MKSHYDVYTIISGQIYDWIKEMSQMLLLKIFSFRLKKKSVWYCLLCQKLPVSQQPDNPNCTMDGW